MAILGRTCARLAGPPESLRGAFALGDVHHCSNDSAVPDSSSKARATTWRCLREPSGIIKRYSWSKSFSSCVARSIVCWTSAASSGCTRWRIGSTVGVVGGQQLSARRQLSISTYPVLARRSRSRSADTGATMRPRQTGAVVRRERRGRRLTAREFADQVDQVVKSRWLRINLSTVCLL